MRVVLTPAQMAFCRKYAELRYGDAKRRGAADYRRGAGESDEERILAHERGLWAEQVIVVILGSQVTAWNFYVQNPKPGQLANLPEIQVAGQSLDAKGALEQHHAMWVPEGAVKPTWAYVLVGCWARPAFWVLGWLWGNQILASPATRPNVRWSSSAHKVSRGDPRLRPFEEFLAEFNLVDESKPAEPRPPPFEGECCCCLEPTPGIYVAYGKWYCEKHRIW